MTRLEAPQVMAAIVILGIIALTIIFVAPDAINEIVGAVVTGIGMLGMKLLEKNGKKPDA